MLVQNADAWPLRSESLGTGPREPVVVVVVLHALWIRIGHPLTVLEWFSSFNVSPDFQEHWKNAPSGSVGLEWGLRF